MRRLLAPFAVGYRAAMALRRTAYRRRWLRTQRLNRPVISVGNLTVGGTGKTPLVAHITRLLLDRGWRPGILTRGYGRNHGLKLVALEPRAGRAPDPRLVGDEPALLARKLPDVPIVVCADRYAGGRVAEDRFNVGVHVLDDGFQHFGLARDLEIVVIDTTETLFDHDLLPVGRLREPWSAVERADVVVLTRVELGDPVPLERKVRRLNPRAEIFYGATKLCELVDLASGRIYPAGAFEGDPVYAFCGIGNPTAFFADLRRWGFSVLTEQAFRDHHLYSGEDLLPILMSLERSPAAAMITTEKDAMNLPALRDSAKPVLACVIESELQEPEAFERAIVGRLELSLDADATAGA
ncbi:MAG TPA: tetraacyldisaccharide 4'-kinase [Terriglobia bacterium]|nr:tetraacyldisaccharide 4'-kinase [Terriglobia bacterium]